MAEQVLDNARLVLAGEVIDGHVAVDSGSISAVGAGRSARAGRIDLEGDYLLPGLVELHTDNLENHVQPRPGVDWPMLSAAMDHDARIATAESRPCSMRSPSARSATTASGWNG